MTSIELAAWLQAIGSIAAVVAAFLVSHFQQRAETRRAEQEKTLRALGLSILIAAEISAFADRITAVIFSEDLKEADLQPPETLVRIADQVFVLGDPGKPLLQMLSALQANRIQVRNVREALSEGHCDFEDAWHPIKRNLEAIQKDASEAIAGLEKIIRSS